MANVFENGAYYDNNLDGKIVVTVRKTSITKETDIPGVIYSADSEMVCPQLILGVATGRCSTYDTMYTGTGPEPMIEVRLFCPFWNYIQEPGYITIVNRNHCALHNPSEATSIKKNIYKDFKDRHPDGGYGFQFTSEAIQSYYADNPNLNMETGRITHLEGLFNLFPYVNPGYNTLCKDLDGNPCSHKDIEKTFNSPGWDEYIKLYIRYMQETQAYGGDTQEEFNIKNYNRNYPLWKRIIGKEIPNYYEEVYVKPVNQLSATPTRNDISIYGSSAYLGGKIKEKGVFISKSDPATKEDTKYKDETSERFSYRFSDFKVYDLEFSTTYYITSYFILEGTIEPIYSASSSFTTETYGALPTISATEHPYYRTPSSVRINIRGNQGDERLVPDSYVLKYGKTRETMIELPSYQMDYRYETSNTYHKEYWINATIQGLDSASFYYFEFSIANEIGTTTINELLIETELANNRGMAQYLLKETFTTVMSRETAWITHSLVEKATISENNAILKGSMTSYGGAPVTEYGFVLSSKTRDMLVKDTGTKKKLNSPQIDFKQSFFGNPVVPQDTWEYEFTELKPGTTYYYNSYAINSFGTVLSGPANFFTTKGSSTETEDPVGKTSIKTNGFNNLTTNGFSVQSSVTSIANGSVTERGVVYSTSPNPTYSDNYSKNGSGLGDYTCFLKELTPGTPYYVRAYAKADIVYYGNEISVSTMLEDNTGVTLVAMAPRYKWNESAGVYSVISGCSILEAGSGALQAMGAGVSLSPSQVTTLGDMFAYDVGANNKEIDIDLFYESDTAIDNIYVTAFAMKNDAYYFSNPILLPPKANPDERLPLTLTHEVITNPNKNLFQIVLTATGDGVPEGEDVSTGIYYGPRNSPKDNFGTELSAIGYTIDLRNLPEGVTYVDSYIIDIQGKKVFAENSLLVRNLKFAPNVINPNFSQKNTWEEDSIELPDIEDVYYGMKISNRGAEWIYNGSKFIRYYGDIAKVSDSTIGGPSKSKESNFTSEFESNKVAYFEVIDKNKFRVLDKEFIFRSAAPNIRIVRFFFDEDMLILDGKEIIITWDNNTVIKTGYIIGGGDNTQLMIEFSGEVDDGIDESLFILPQEIADSNEVFVQLVEGPKYKVALKEGMKLTQESLDIDLSSLEEASY